MVVVLPSPRAFRNPDKDRVLTEPSHFPKHVVISRIEKMQEQLHSYREKLEGRSILVKMAHRIIVRTVKSPARAPGYLVTYLSFSCLSPKSAWAELVRCIGSHFQRASRNRRSSPRNAHNANNGVQGRKSVPRDLARDGTACPSSRQSPQQRALPRGRRANEADVR
jgi:hypothetical protein